MAIKNTPAKYKRHLTDEELRSGYMEVFIRYALKGIGMSHPETVPIFTGKERKRTPKKYKKLQVQ